MMSLLSIIIFGCKKDKTDPVITWPNPADINYGTLLSEIHCNATTSVDGTFTYSPKIGTLLNVGLNQDLEVAFTPADVNKYNMVIKTVKINVMVAKITFNPNITYGSQSDKDGNIYKTVTIGSQTWMAENLRTTKYRNGDPIPQVTDNTSWKNLNTGAYCNYKNTLNTDTIFTFGRLYNWYAATDSRNIAPEGWHIPTNSDWITLETYVGKEFLDGNKLKENSLGHWTAYFYTSEGYNSTGFTAFPAGFRYNDGTFGSYNICNWWSSSLNGTSGACLEILESCLFNYFGSKTAGWSIRCIKD